MKLKTYMRIKTQKELGVHLRNKLDKLYIRLYKSSGIITFSTPLVAVLKIQKYSSVTIHQDTNYPENWYLEVGGGDYSVYEINAHQLGFCCLNAVSDFWEQFNVKEKTLKCLVTIEPLIIEEKNLYQLDTRDLVKK